MIDPISAVAMATGAFNTIKAGFAAGREIESMAGDLGRWMGAVSDIKKAEEYNSNPPLFKKLFQAGSVEEEAMQIFMAKKKAEDIENAKKIIANNNHWINYYEHLPNQKVLELMKWISHSYGFGMFIHFEKAYFSVEAKASIDKKLEKLIKLVANNTRSD